MASTYPAILDNFTNPSGTQTQDNPDHALQHSNANDAVENIQSVLGTTAGTSVLKSFSAGQFPARTNVGGTIVQTLIGGTINNTILGTPSITGGTASSFVGTASTNNFTAKGLQTATNTVSVSAATAPTVNQALVATNGSTATWQSISTTSTTVLLSYIANTDLADTLAISATTWTDSGVNQSFIVNSATSKVAVSCNGNYRVGAGASIQDIAARLVFDVAGTPITRYLSGNQVPGTALTNVLSGAGDIVLTGLTAGTHTVKMQIYNTVAGQAFCRASTQPNTEFFSMYVLEQT